jgi:hypothetical protein
VEVVWFSKINGKGIFGSSWSVIGDYSTFFVSETTNVFFLTRSATSIRNQQR